MNHHLATWRPPHRFLRLVILMLIVAMAVPDSGRDGPPRTVAAFNGGSCGGGSAAVVSNPLVLAPLESLAEPAILLQMHRLTVLPGASTPRIADAGPAVYAVDGGVVAVQIAGEATRTRFLVTETGQWSAPDAITGSTALHYRDYLSVPANVPIRIENQGSVPAVLLVTRIVPVLADIIDPFPDIDDMRIERVLLASGVVSNLAAVPVTLVVVRVVYAVGAADSAETANVGPQVIAVEEGAIGYRISSGDSIASFAATGQMTPVRPNLEVTVTEGDWIVEQPGVTRRFRNLAADRSWLLFATLIPSRDSDTVIACL
ncbi:MAG: hypothetical protein IT336_07295 [Thermomicrobiales bacterium]|nr:hypothetical protein [Thermomicrobiales bacterium]